MAANGAIMITTKSASAGRISVSVSSNTTIDKRIADIRRIVFLIYSGITSFRQAIALSVRG